MGAEMLIILTALSGWPELSQENRWPELPPPVLIAPVPDSLQTLPPQEEGGPAPATAEDEGTGVFLPVIEINPHERTAPENYNMPMPTKRVAIPCPYHGYRCGMQRVVEDLIGHLQSVHDVPLEDVNGLDRNDLVDYHDDLHWCEETAERQEAFLNPPKAVSVKASGCATGNCPVHQRRGLFR
jgi:hypothetical protein